ncbi:MAG: HAD family phosphatase [Deltaproteobacteria bacterium]|nr:HAD family phosphatase [Deltaproteobacteria bacterium]
MARVVGGYGALEGAWQRLERGELALAEFASEFDAQARAAGVELDSADLMRALGGAALRPVMLGAIRRLRGTDLRVGALTNNWVTGPDHDERLAPLRDEFHVFVESCKVGMRKPELPIYHLACERLGTSPGEVIFLDDMGPNLKAARSLGMTTIKVAEPEAALGELWAVLEREGKATGGAG